MEKINRHDMVKKIVDNLSDKKIVIGGNKILYKNKYHLKYTQQIVDNVLEALFDTVMEELENGNMINFTPFGHDKQVKLHYWNTEEEAFQEYKLFKESDIRTLALRYRDKIPDRLFDALIKYEVRPYSPYEDLRFQRGKRYKTELNQ